MTNQYTGDNNSVVTYHRRDANLGAAVLYTSSMVVNLRQLQTDLSTQHQHEKTALTELNQRFHLFVDRIQHLQSQNAKYLAAVLDWRRQSSGYGGVDIQWDERSLALKSDLSAVSNAKVDYEWDFELFQLQIAIYQKLIDIEHHGRNNRSLILEDELKQSASTLIALRTSYAELQRQVEMLYAEGADLFKRYISLTYDWCNVKKQQKKWDLNLKSLRNYIAFYKNLRSYSGGDYTALTVQTDDMQQYWALELEKVKKRIRHDFQMFYSTIHQEMVGYYGKKMEEVEKDVKQALIYQQAEFEEFSMHQQTYQVEYEKVQKSLVYEREVIMKLEATYSKLESEYRAIQLRHEEQFEAQAQELHSAQENIMALAYDVDEIRFSKAMLEAEIIVYRDLLDLSGIEQRVSVTQHTKPTGNYTHVPSNEMAGKIVVRKQKKRWISIRECAPNGAYITLMNHSTNKDIDISRWALKQVVDSVTKFRYTIPDGARLERGTELRIYANPRGGPTAESLSHQRIVNKDIVSWGIGNTVETILFNENGDEEASYSHSVAFRRDNVL